MLEVVNAVYPSPRQWEIVIRGMRNPLNSWDRSDSFICYGETLSEVEPTEAFCQKCPNSTFIMDGEDLDNVTREDLEFLGCVDSPLIAGAQFRLGEKDLKLARNLVNAGDEHAKFLRMLPVHMDIRAPLSWFKQFDTYSHVVKNSCSSMHRLMAKPFEREDFSLECTADIDEYLEALNGYRARYLETGDKYYWYKTEELLLQSYNQLRTISTNYAVLFRICAQRAGHKKSEWNTLIEYVLENTPYFREICFDKLTKVSENFNLLFE